MKSVSLGLSGGVDSAAAAIILKEKGYKVIALYFDVLEQKLQAANTNNTDGDDQKSPLIRAQNAAKALDLEFVSKNVSAEFEEKIINPFCMEYCSGRTPIPCVFCNPLIKFKTLASLDTDFIATGHYARIKEINGTFFVQKAKNEKKDQSYMLARLPQEILRKTIFPLGEISSKEEVRSIVGAKGLKISTEHDSQDICFIKGSYKDFLAERGISSVRGNFISPDGKIYGQNDGVANYTVGQRKGIGIALGVPAFVSEINTENGDVVLTSNEEDLFKKQVKINNLMLHTSLKDKEYQVKLRYAAKPAVCRIKIDCEKTECQSEHNSAILYFDDPQRAPTPGQAAVIYDDDIVIGSGIIYN